MTIRNSDYGQTVDELLLDSGHSDAPELRAALMSLGSLANLPAPEPSAELAALMAGPHNDLTRQRWLRKHRPAVVGIAVLTGMGLGVTGVAASSPVSLTFDERVSIQDVAQDWTPGWTVPVALPPAAEPAVASAVVPAPAVEPAAQALSGDPAPQADPATDPAAVPDTVASGQPVQSPAAQGAKPSADAPGRRAHGSNGQAKDNKTPATASPKGKAKKNDAGAAAVSAAAAAQASEAAARELSGVQRLRTESSRPGAGVKQLLQNASHWSGTAKGNSSGGRHAADFGTSWLQKFRR